MHATLRQHEVCGRRRALDTSVDDDTCMNECDRIIQEELLYTYTLLIIHSM